jgi:resuscitation-promoting factor RpfB
MKLRTKAVVGTFLVLTAAGSLPASHAAAGHHANGGGRAVLDVLTSGLPANERLANQLAAARGWGTGQQACLDKLWDEESAHTWSGTVANPTSDALGIAQALTHGTSSTAGTLGNQYGGYGLTDAQARQANSGSAKWQIKWGLDYIADTYRTPCGALHHEKSTNPNWY